MLNLVLGKNYNWKYQPERLVYLGQEGPWYQFALVENPGEVWCEVLDADLKGIEETEVKDD